LKDISDSKVAFLKIGWDAGRLPLEMVCNLVHVCATLLEAYCCSYTVGMRYEPANIDLELVGRIRIGDPAGMAHDVAVDSHTPLGAPSCAHISAQHPQISKFCSDINMLSSNCRMVIIRITDWDFRCRSIEMAKKWYIFGADIECTRAVRGWITDKLPWP
jgi:hypothetical protein